MREPKRAKKSFFTRFQHVFKRDFSLLFFYLFDDNFHSSTSPFLFYFSDENAAKKKFIFRFLSDRKGPGSNIIGPGSPGSTQRGGGSDVRGGGACSPLLPHKLSTGYT